MADNFSTTTESVTLLKTGSGMKTLKTPVEVERDPESGRLTEDSSRHLKSVASNIEKHREEKQQKNMEAALAQVAAAKDPALAQIAALTENRKDSSNPSVSTKGGHSREGASLA